QAAMRAGVVQHGLRDFLHDIAAGGGTQQARNADAFAALDEYLGQGKAEDQRAVELGVLRERRREIHRWRTVRPDPDRVRGLPLLLADVQMIVARRAPPVYARSRFAGHEAAILPEVL